MALYRTTGSLGRGLGTQQGLYDIYSKMAGEAKAANVKRETEIRDIYADIINSISGSNESLRAAGLKDIESQANKAIGQQTQNLISSGLYGTTTAAAVPTQVATQFTQPARLKLEDFLSSRKREAQLGLAGFIERIENPYPDYSALMQAEIANASVPRVNTTPSLWSRQGVSLSTGQGKYNSDAEIKAAQAKMQASESAWWKKQKELYG